MITSAALNNNHTKLVTCSASDDTIKMFDILNCDLIASIKLNFSPMAIQYVMKKDSGNELLAMYTRLTVALQLTTELYIYTRTVPTLKKRSSRYLSTKIK